MPRATATEKTRRSKTATEVEKAPSRSRRKTAVAEEAAPTTRRRRGTAAAEEAAPTTRRRRGTAAAAEAAPEKRTRSSRAKEEPAPTRSRRGASKEEPAEEKSSRRSVAVEGRTKTKAAEAVSSAFNPYANLDDKLDEIEKSIGVSESTLDPTEVRLSTGSLMQDLVLGGGITAGWYTNFGQEQCCKTTDAVQILISALNSNVPILGYYDYEGSAEPNYIENNMKAQGVKADVKSIFGVRDEKTGKYLIAPRVRYRTEGVAEKFFDYIAKLQRMLPDKKKIGEQWYYIYDSKTADGKIHKANTALVGKHYDQAYFRKTGKYRIPAPDGSLQALILVDSYPGMLPETQDVDDPNNAVATQARMFSNQLKRVKGRMKSKRMAVIGINQLRLRPMQQMGNPEYETCGEALKLYSDVRMKFTSRALSGVSKYLGEGVKGEGMIESEPSVIHKKGEDQYRYIHIRGHKNKLSRPYLQTYMRLWITDPKGQSYGFDPVWDTFLYLKETGQLVGKRRKLTIKMEKHEAERAIDWLDFKRLILLPAKDTKGIFEYMKLKPFNLREACFKQIRSRRGIELYYDWLSGDKEDSKGSDSDAGTSGSDEE